MSKVIHLGGYYCTRIRHAWIEDAQAQRIALYTSAVEPVPSFHLVPGVQSTTLQAKGLLVQENRKIINSNFEVSVLLSDIYIDGHVDLMIGKF